MPMICSVRTLGVNGISGSLVMAESYISNGLPNFEIVGLPDTAVKEARNRVRAAARSSGMSFPVSRIHLCTLYDGICQHAQARHHPPAGLL